MTQEHRYVGVARPPQGIDPAPPRVVLDVIYQHVPTDAAETVSAAAPLTATATASAASTASAAATASPTATPSPTATVSAAATVRATATVRARATATVRAMATVAAPIAARPRRYARMADHRRRWRRVIFRRYEVAAWVGAVAVLVGMAAYVVREVPVLGPPAEVNTEALPLAEGAAAACVFEPCSRPGPFGRPTRLRIPSITVDSPLEVLALDSTGMLEPPKSYGQAGWYGQGVVPGDAGPAILAGHVDSLDGPAVFYNLHTLKYGATVEVQRGGEWIAFRVTSVERYQKNRFPTNRVYQPTPGAELRLITCGGDFDWSRKSYRDNIVVFAVLA